MDEKQESKLTAVASMVATATEFQTSLICPLQLVTNRNREAVTKAVQGYEDKLGKWDGTFVRIGGIQVVKLGEVSYELWAYNRSDPGIEYYPVPIGAKGEHSEGWKVVGSHGRNYEVRNGQIGMIPAVKAAKVQPKTVVIVKQPEAPKVETTAKADSTEKKAGNGSKPRNPLAGTTIGTEIPKGGITLGEVFKTEELAIAAKQLK